MTWRYSILEKLHKIGLRGHLPLFISSFLNNRQFRVKLGHTFSAVKCLENGVVQGSPSSCPLFDVAINDIAENVDSSVMKLLYVDDLAIACSGYKMEGIAEKLQAAIDIIVDNGQRIGFRFSEEKTTCVHFCRKTGDHPDPALFMNGNPIPSKDTVKFLGLTFDRKLNWKSHIEQLKNRCRRSLDIIKELSHTKWGAEPKKLLILYRALVMSRLDYGSIVYSSARKTVLSKLDSVHNMGIRLCIGAFKTSPSQSLYCESGIMPLHLRRKQLLCSYMIRLKGYKTHINNNYLFEKTAKFQTRPTITRPAGIRFGEYLENINLNIPEIFYYSFNEIPPWKIPEMRTHTQLLALEKENTPHEVYQKEFLNILDKISPNCVIYTDGSKTKNGVGTAITIGEDSHSWSLPQESSVYFAEQYAIWQALLFCLWYKKEKPVIVTDSLSVLTSLRDIYTSDPITQKIQSVSAELRMKNCEVELIWVPSHVGIKGNEVVDRAAKTAAALNEKDVKTIKITDLINSVKQCISSEWQRAWSSCNAKLKPFKKDVRTPYISVTLPRLDMIRIHRLRIGHTALTHLYIFKKEERPKCELCNIDLSTFHILYECPKYTSERSQHNITDEPNLHEEESIRNTIEFLKTIRIYHKL
ncbi:uncharacterized protein LOC123322831 [Coccinella septempunctata]|uniref:uncharacterized protein LOC123322831 n=1 Tax=Coccinella septempunctata TaxID=41139 RepID=UPI001D09421D|nr:uncharacterized protein LOC123322831 [Coccinella septempunctata]